MFTKFHDIVEKRVTNRSVYLCIHRHGPISKNEILKMQGGSLANLNRFLGQLEESGMVARTRGSGRRPGMYRIVTDSGYAFGAYVTGNVVGIGLCDISGKVHDVRETFFSDLKKPDKVVDFLAASYRDLYTESIADRYLGTTIAITGPVDRQAGVILSPVNHLPGWVNVPFVELLQEALDTKVDIELFAEAILLGELFFGTHDIGKQIALLWLDHGIGASISNKGRMNLDQSDRTSILGHQVVDFGGIPCQCGKRGCLLTYGTIPSLKQNLQPYLRLDRLTMNQIEERYRRDPWGFSTDLETIEDSIVTEGLTPQASIILDDFDKAYFAGLSNVINVLRPDKVLFCGRLAIKYRERLTKVMTQVIESSTYFGGHTPEIEWFDLDREHLIRGSAARVFNKYVNLVE